MRHIFIINPVAGKGKTQHDIENKIHALLKNKKTEYEVYFTKFKGDVNSFVINKCKDEIPTVFYACGGDGTLHEVINSAYNFNHACVGIIPCGSGNDFVKNFENRTYFEDIDLQINGEVVKLDLIKVKDEYAASVCNVGFDADAGFNMHKFKKIPFITGSGCYIMSVFYCLLKKLGKDLKVVIDESETINGTFLLGVIANGHSYGGGYKCAPKAAINDGIMDLCFVKNMSRLNIISLINNYKTGNHLENNKLKKYITYRKCKHVKITSVEPINLCIDGENYACDELDFKIVPNALNFWLPKGVQIQENKNRDGSF
ncbi:MAG: YegS/Rv2252/BmrU family lipid kinase [Sedimentibacter sp.]|uniref:diacylglycerol/lipid kinase family protein n=1 Tax=Sedimentibacter sp. TaxID=1960295 RepID=UPI00298125F0|nr:YegS/Rv2252/BmrU family lipid kinase [Sedimentibacter sp.]MDW5300390.1 YegS/Rv2252/BmrU family lipid kinase [Sedimentibacter sp.]